MSEQGDLWVFGYGSLMWHPGFPFVERRPAIVRGYHRLLCIYSFVHRGTPEKPGLVLGLDRGGSCRGLAFRVEAEHRAQTIDYLREREQATSVYREAALRTVLDDGRRIAAIGYVADRSHPQYAGELARPDLLRLVEQGVGIAGPNPIYVRRTYEHLIEMGIEDNELRWLCERLSEEVSAA